MWLYESVIITTQIINIKIFKFKIPYVDGSMLLCSSYSTTHTLLFHTYHHLSTTNNWALSLLCVFMRFSFFLFHFFTHHRIITLNCVELYIHIFTLFFFRLFLGLIPTSLPHVRRAFLLGKPCLVPVAIIFVDLFLVSSCSSFPNTQPH